LRLRDRFTAVVEAAELSAGERDYVRGVNGHHDLPIGGQ
jgi:hypothetical protein